MRKDERNSWSFSKQERDEGLMSALLTLLAEYNDRSTTSYMDIHLSFDEGYATVEWIKRFYGHLEDSGSFEYVREDQVVASVCEYPDGTSCLCYDDEEVKTALAEYEAEHKGASCKAASQEGSEDQKTDAWKDVSSEEDENGRYFYLYMTPGHQVYWVDEPTSRTLEDDFLGSFSTLYDLYTLLTYGGLPRTILLEAYGWTIKDCCRKIFCKLFCLPKLRGKSLDALSDDEVWQILEKYVEESVCSSS